MKKTLFKASLLGLAILAIVLIPGNSQLAFGYDTPTFAGSTTNAPTCGNEKPDKVVLYQPNHSLLPKATDPNSVRLNWLKANRANKYTIAFGLASGNYIYGLPDVGDTNNFTVNHLTSGKTYYFVVRGANGCMPGPWSREWAVRIGGGGRGGSLTTLNTNSPRVVTPPNIVPATGTPPQDLQATPTTQPAGGLPVYNSPTPTPAPQPGFFQRFWRGFLGIFGR